MYSRHLRHFIFSEVSGGKKKENWQQGEVTEEFLLITNRSPYNNGGRNHFILEVQNVRNFSYPVRIRWSRQANLVPFYLYNRIFECPENIRNVGFPDVRWSSREMVCCWVFGGVVSF